MECRPSLRLSDVAGLEDAKTQIYLRLVYPFQHPASARRFNQTTGGGVLLYGPPGCGKTMLARATAGELGCDVFVVSASDIMSKWVGQAEQNVKSLFEQAKQSKMSSNISPICNNCIGQ